MDHQIMDNQNGNNWSGLIYVLAVLCQFALSLDIESIYTWTFRGLSMLSVILIIIINWKKAIKVIKGK